MSNVIPFPERRQSELQAHSGLYEFFLDALPPVEEPESDEQALFDLGPTFVNKDDVRPPILSAAQLLGIRVEGDKARCVFHDDHNPSMRFWESDIERYHCGSCGASGDVYDLIMHVQRCSFREALGWVTSHEFPKVEARVLAPTPPWTDVQREAHEQALREYGSPDGLADFFKMTPDWDPVLRYWGLVQITGSVRIPHRTPDGTLTGIKVRHPDGTKSAITGSKLPALYGSWLGRRHPLALITEGESDAYWASGQGLNIDVYSLPAGAGKPPKPEWFEFLDHGPIVTAFDNDPPGEQATARFAAAAAEAGIPCSALVFGRRGQDLREAAPDLRALLHPFSLDEEGNMSYPVPVHSYSTRTSLTPGGPEG